MTKYLVFLLEEPSAQDLLEGLIPRLIPAGIEVRFLVFEGKQDLEQQLQRKLRGWRIPDTAFVILRDQDAGNCTEVKAKLTHLAAGSGQSNVLVRIACRELESWAVGDWRAVAEAFDRPELGTQAVKAIYRVPDRLVRPVDELRKFIRDYQKRDGARRLGKLLLPERNESRSFKVFCSGILRLIGAPRTDDIGSHPA